MIVFKKFLILKEVNNSGYSAILKLENFLDQISGSIKVSGGKGIYKLAIQFNQEVVILDVSQQEDFILETEVDLNNFIQAILLRDKEVLCAGSTKGSDYSYSSLYGAYIQALNKEQSEQNKNDVPEEEPPFVNEVEPVIDAVVEETVNVEPEEKKEEPQPIEPSHLEETVTPQEPIFYNKVKDKLDMLFSSHKREEELENKIPNSKWVRVEIMDSSFYVVGIIYDNDEPTLICYGVPDKDASNPPQNNKKCMQWLEIEEGSRGYWMMYQNAIDGKTLSQV